MTELENFGKGVQFSYDQIADEYAFSYSDELTRKPFDRELLVRYAEAHQGKGWVCEVGGGPGQIGYDLFKKGLQVVSSDLSWNMLQAGKSQYPDMPFLQVNMLQLPFASDSLAGIVAFYSIIHFHRTQLATVFAGMLRALQEGGSVLLSFHVGSNEIHLDKWYEKPVNVDTSFFEVDEVKGYLQEAGFRIHELHVRQPYEKEYPSQRVYIWAVK